MLLLYVARLAAAIFDKITLFKLTPIKIKQKIYFQKTSHGVLGFWGFGVLGVFSDPSFDGVVLEAEGLKPGLFPIKNLSLPHPTSLGSARKGVRARPFAAKLPGTGPTDQDGRRSQGLERGDYTLAARRP